MKKRLTALCAVIIYVIVGCGAVGNGQLGPIGILAYVRPGLRLAELSGEGGDRLFFGRLHGEPGLDELMDMAGHSRYMNQIKKHFAGTLFIGDSRTVGIQQYSGIGTADYFCATGMSVYDVFEKQLDVGGEKQDLSTLLGEKSYGRVFIMLGINELGYNVDTIAEKYGQVVDQIIELQPDAEVWVQLNLRVSAQRSEKDPVYNNVRINQLNESIKALADQRGLPTLDVNSLFDDGYGNLSEEYTFDHTHILGRYYKAWAIWMYIRTSQV